VLGLFDTEIVRVASTNLQRQRLRSYLTLLGMVIGIAAIVALFALSSGLNVAVEAMFEDLGLDTITVQSGSGMNFSTAVSQGIEEADIGIIEGIPGVEAVLGFYETAAIAKYRDKEMSAFLIGYDPNKTEYLQDMMGYLKLGKGRLLKSSDLYGILINESFAETGLDGKELTLKQKIEIDEMDFRVVGIIDDADQAFGSFGINNMFWITKNAAMTLFGQDEPVELMVKVTDESIAETVAEKIEDRLERAHGEKDFYVMTTESLMDSFNNVLGVMQIVLLLLAGISVVVGAIGIMNTMLMAVLERTREIGAMKAIGATNNKVLSIFIAEAGLLGLVGGSVGVILGYLTAIGISVVAGSFNFVLPIFPDPFIIAFGMLVSLVVGMVSGIVPARRAALMDPVEALRYE